MGFKPPAVIAAVMVAVAGCSDTGTSDGGSRARAVVDESAGSIELPLDRYGIRTHERATLQYAFDLLMHECMAGKGLEWEIVDRRHVPEPTSRRYGVWLESEAARFGYMPPPPSAEEQRLEELNAATYPDGWHEASIECGQSASEVVVVEPTLSEIASFEQYEEALTVDAAEDALADWKRCLEAQGVDTADGWVPAGAEDAPLEQQIAIAMKDVGCKREVNLIQRVADAEAQWQEKHLEQHEAALSEQRSQIEDSLDAARGVIASEG